MPGGGPARRRPRRAGTSGSAVGRAAMPAPAPPRTWQVCDAKLNLDRKDHLGA